MYSIGRVLVFLLLFLVTFTSAFSQEQDPDQARDYMEVAEGMIEGSMAFNDVREIVVVAADLDTTFLKANFQAGELHLLTIGKDLAVKYFLRVYRQDPAYRFDIEFWIAKSYQMGLEFDKAIDFYTRYKDRLSKKPNYQGKDKVDLSEVNRAIFECENGKEFVAHPGNFSIVNIGREINSPDEDYAPVFNEREDQIVFTSRRREDNLNENVYEDNKPYEDIYIAYKKGGTWQQAKNMGPPINTIYHESNLALSADGSTLFIYNDDNGGDIYFSEKQADGTWGPRTPLPGIINSSYEEKSITISKDEKTLYFTSNRPGGFGGIDLYKATLDSKGTWSNVRNLGAKINTEFDEEGPFIDYDGVTLYFSSKGHKGMGGHDIYRATFNPQANDWSEPENMGYPINTPDDDVFFVASQDGKHAYYSSVRDDGMGYTDIYVITVPEGLKETHTVASTEPVVEKPVEQKPVEQKPVEQKPVEQKPVEQKPVEQKPVEQKPVEQKPVEKPKKVIKPTYYVVTVLDADTKSPMSAKVRMQGLRDNVIVPATTTEEGVYSFTITSEKAKDYRLSVELEGYAFQNQTVKIQGATEEEKTLTRTIEMRKLVVGLTGILRNIYFDFDKATFKDESYNELNKLERMMKENQALTVQISGHTDNFGPKHYNQYLSRKRAEAVKDFLTKKGIDSRRVQAVGYGESKPLATNDDENEGRELNRRVEFTVIKN